MKKLIKMQTLVKDGHHMFNYEDGIKDSIPDDGVVFTDLAHRTKTEECLRLQGTLIEQAQLTVN